MEDCAVQGESPDDSSELQTQRPRMSNDSRLSEGSYGDRDDPIDVEAYADSEFDSYSGASERYQDRSHESHPPVVAEPGDRTIVRIGTDGPTGAYNKIDSSEMTVEPSVVGKRTSEEAARSRGPKSSRGKDSSPLLPAEKTVLDENTMRERVARVVALLSSTRISSIRAAIARNPHRALGDLTLAELAPKEAKSNGQSRIANGPTATTSKHGPAEDTRTTGYEESFDSEAAISLPLLTTGAASSDIRSDIPVPASEYTPKSAKRRRRKANRRKHEPSVPTFALPEKTETVRAEPPLEVHRDTGAVFVDRSKGAIPKVSARTQEAPPRNMAIAGETANASAAPGTNRETLPLEETPADDVCMEMYYKLRSIFPTVDPNYLKGLCPPEWEPGDRDAQFAPIVEYLLENANGLPLAPAQSYHDDEEAANGHDVAYGNVDDVYENLLGIFPNGDPHYLRDFAERNVGNADAIKEFVETKLEKHDYPTREQYRARLKITERQRQYTTGFNVANYLTIIPDPFKHFLDANRKCTYVTIALEFLKSHFNNIRVTTVSSTYTRCSYNLSITAEALERTPSDIKSKRASVEIPTEDILLLQEIAFVKHKNEIREHMANVKRAEETEFRIMKEQNFLVECQCCYDPECLPSKCSSCDNGHLFCNNCVVAGTSAKLGEGESCISCFVNCGSEISLSALQRVLAPTTFSILLTKRQAAEITKAGLEGLVSCPFCNFSSIPPEEDKIFKCLNPECTKESCRLCKEPSHVPLKCEEVMNTKKEKARHYIEEKMTEALARVCYKCKRPFFKEEGCNKISCPCGARMCYVCNKPIADYSHFRARDSDPTDRRCPLTSDSVRLNEVAVRRVGEEAQMEVMRRNPRLTVDTTDLLPGVATRT